MNHPKFFKILVFTATYNEINNIQNLLNEIHLNVSEADILVVDDSSPDGTGLLLDNIRKNNSKINIINRSGKLGLGSAHLLAFKYAIANNYDILITMDADGSHDPIHIPAIIEKLEKSDFVIGSRYIKGGKCDYTGYRKTISIAANLLARSMLGIPLHEYTTSFRGIKVSSIAKLDISSYNNNGYSFFMECVYRFFSSGLKLDETPIYFKDRKHGSSKIPKLEIFRGFINLLKLTALRLSKSFY